MSSISVLIITYNEEENIEECLKGLTWADEIIVIDSYSKDNTLNIAKQYTDLVFQRKFDDFSSQRNYGLEKAKSEWILVVDADERVTEPLKDEIILSVKNSNAQAFKIPRKNYFLGKWIKYCGWYPDYTLRLFRQKYRYSGLVHETVKVDEPIKSLKNELIHYTYRDIHHYINKINSYTTLDAENKFRKGKKRSILYILIRPQWEFFNKFILKRGILLGKAGLFLSVLSSYYQFLKQIKLWEKHNKQ